jgi:predicted RNase H-like HicB family nuclease
LNNLQFSFAAPELPDCSAFGNTEEEALKEIKVAIDLWLEAAEKKAGKFQSS